jgi:replication factor C subunit 2/4
MENLPWIEKYRPVKLHDIIGNPIANKQFHKILETGNIPHMLLSGIPGTGKTTSVLCLANAMLGEHFNQAFMELNASDERGIDVIRNKISIFCKKKMELPNKAYKIIFLDEVDCMTSTAQHALRRMIELYTPSTRFIMACNSSSNIIEAIQSRCVLLRFGQIQKDAIMGRLKYICEKENLEYNVEALEYLILTANGDMRRAVNNLQSVYLSLGKITIENIRDAINLPDLILIEKLLEGCLANDLKKSEEMIRNLIGDGFSACDIIQVLFNIIKEKDIIDISVKLKYMKYIGKTQMNLVNGGDPLIQLMALIAKMINNTNENKVEVNQIEPIIKKPVRKPSAKKVNIKKEES